MRKTIDSRDEDSQWTVGQAEETNREKCLRYKNDAFDFTNACHVWSILKGTEKESIRITTHLNVATVNQSFEKSHIKG